MNPEVTIPRAWRLGRELKHNPLIRWLPTKESGYRFFGEGFRRDVVKSTVPDENKEGQSQPA